MNKINYINDDDNNITDVWRDFEKGRAYNRNKNLYNDTEKNYDFYFGNQARYLNIGKETPVVLNIIKSIVKYKLGVVNSNAYEIVYNPNFFEDSGDNSKVLEEICKTLSKHSSKIWELQQVDVKIREALKDSCINDEGIIHHFFDKNDDEVVSEVIDKNNIYYGNENDSDIQSQPYIIISYRKPVRHVREEAKKIGLSDDDIELINYDGETQEQTGYKNTTDEVNPMCLVLLKYYKKEDGIVYYTRSVKSVILEKDIKTNLKLYPVAHICWEELKGSARGIGAVRNIIANQIEINKIATRRALCVKLSAFPKLIYNGKYIQNSEALNKAGASIKVTGDGIDDIKKQIGYLNPANMSTDAKNLEDDLQINTKELEGAGDVAQGNVNVEQASGKAIVAVQHATQQPLNEQVITYKRFIEDIARIYYDMWKAYKVNGMKVIYESKDENGNIVFVPTMITNEQLQKLDAQIKVDITPRSPYDRVAQEQSIENLMTSGKITFEEYVEALPDGSVMPKYILQNILKNRQEKQQKIDMMQQEAMQKQFDLQNAMNNNIDSTINDIENQANSTQNKFNEMIGGNDYAMSQM